MVMKTKPKVGRIRKRIMLSMSEEAIGMLDDVSKTMGMSRSGFVEFMVRQVIRADRVPMGQMVQETLEVFMKK